MIEVQGLTKRYGDRVAVDHIDFALEPGQVTGFLGPNGAGKSTTMRMILGLTRPTEGSVTIDGWTYHGLPAPLTAVGALLDAKAVHPGRSAYQHLLSLAATHGLPTSRVHEVIGMTGLDSVAGKRVKGFSLGMGQRLGIAAAMLGDPQVLILDEPVNGLDPEGVRWVREFARQLAAEGRTVFLSSHLMSEVALTADRVIVIGKGRILADAPVAELVAGAGVQAVRVRTAQVAEFATLLARSGATVTSDEPDVLVVAELPIEQVAQQAAQAGIVLLELTPVTTSLEDAYMAITDGAVEYRTAALAGGAR